MASVARVSEADLPGVMGEFRGEDLLKVCSSQGQGLACSGQSKGQTI